MRNRFHALCPYFAMFPEAFAEHWIAELTEEHDVVLDPFCGRGTAPFQALLMDRRSVAGDINPVAYVLTRAKLRTPALPTLLSRLKRLRSEYYAHDGLRLPPTVFFQHAYQQETFSQISFLKDALRWKSSDTDATIAALVLGSLHGEVGRSKNYLSNQMPRTISTKPAYSVRFWHERGYTAPQRDVFEVVERQARYRYASERPRNKGTVHLADMRSLPLKQLEPARLLITSPPYLDTTSFEEDQWLRLWFLGGPAEPHRGRLSRDDRLYTRDGYWDMISDLWRVAGSLVAEGGHVVIRIAGKGLTNDDLAMGLVGTSVCSGRSVQLVSSSVSDIVRRQTDAFRPGSSGLRTEIDCHFKFSS